MVDGLNSLSMLLPGVAVTYQGEEIGMKDGYVSWEDTVDVAACNQGNPDNYMDYSRDPARTPYHWDSSISAGFSTNATTWLPVAEDYMEINLQKQKEDDRSHYKALSENTFILVRYLVTFDTYALVFNVGTVTDTVDLAAMEVLKEPLSVVVGITHNIKLVTVDIHTRHHSSAFCRSSIVSDRLGVMEPGGGWGPGVPTPGGRGHPHLYKRKVSHSISVYAHNDVAAFARDPAAVGDDPGPERLVEQRYCAKPGIIDLAGIDQRYGGLDQFNGLIEKAKKLGLSAAMASAQCAWLRRGVDGVVLNPDFRPQSCGLKLLRKLTSSPEANRITSRYGSDMIDAINLLSLILPGAAIIQQGDELGAADAILEWASKEACWPNPGNPSAAPFPWDDSTNAGFTAGEPWLPLAPNYRYANAKTQFSNEGSHVGVVKIAAAMRKSPAIGPHAEIKRLGDALAVLRWGGAGSLLVVSNLGKGQTEVQLSRMPGLPTTMTVAIGSAGSSFSSGSHVNLEKTVKLGPGETILLAGAPRHCGGPGPVDKIASKLSEGWQKLNKGNAPEGSRMVYLQNLLFSAWLMFTAAKIPSTSKARMVAGGALAGRRAAY
ncbi:hypothetical protein MSG28_001922 [Choristoneura fumiferana]|uniref:Uncharacterized protein n=1 Tax=Choristoneura fumiferana TaxID=7141 RepID=A0ACC0JTB3_CHOFU|nr:hypothetical protein MSG28_001922 [Choristoneura fumiferana]